MEWEFIIIFYKICKINSVVRPERRQVGIGKTDAVLLVVLVVVGLEVGRQPVIGGQSFPPRVY